MTLIERYKELDPTFSEDVELQSCLRINTLKVSEKPLLKRLQRKKILLQKIPYLDYGYIYQAPFSLGATPEYLQGYYYLQELASQIPVQILEPKENDTVLDMAAAPGSKTTQMAQYMHNKGSIVALDSQGHRLRSLANNLERCGVSNTISYRKDARFAFDLKMQFSKILLDAPCTGNFCIEKGFFDKRTLALIKENARTQKELLKAGLQCLKPEGTLVYSTCSLEPEENEMMINWLIEKYPDIYLEKINFPIGDPGLTKVFGQELNPEVSKTLRLWPHKTRTQGFFIAKIRKK
jgi:tRNA (cytosine40_48-C5)-methyltransferase